MLIKCSKSAEQHEAFKSVIARLDEQVHTAVDPDRILDFRLGVDGYSELCAWFGVPADKCPAGPFPHVNTANELEAVAAAMLGIHYAALALAVAVLAFAAYGAHKCGCCGCCCCFGCCGRRRRLKKKEEEEKEREEEKEATSVDKTKKAD